MVFASLLHLTMKLVYVVCFMLPACMGFIAHVQHLKDHVHAKVQHLKDHIKEKLKKPECHVEWEDVTTPHCETHKEQVAAASLISIFVLLRFVWRSTRTSVIRSTAPHVRPSTTRR